MGFDRTQDLGSHVRLADAVERNHAPHQRVPLVRPLARSVPDVDLTGEPEFVDRMWLVLLSIFAVLFPLSRILPPLYEFRVRSRVFRWYATLRQIEDDLVAGADRGALLRRVNELDARLERLHVPLSYADELYALRSHLLLVRGKLRDEDVRPAPVR